MARDHHVTMTPEADLAFLAWNASAREQGANAPVLRKRRDRASVHSRLGDGARDAREAVAVDDRYVVEVDDDVVRSVERKAVEGLREDVAQRKVEVANEIDHDGVPGGQWYGNRLYHVGSIVATTEIVLRKP